MSGKNAVLLLVRNDNIVNCIAYFRLESQDFSLRQLRPGWPPIPLLARSLFGDNIGVFKSIGFRWQDSKEQIKTCPSSRVLRSGDRNRLPSILWWDFSQRSK